MCLNVFIDIVIEFHHHFLIVTFLPCTPTYTCFFHFIQWLPSQHAIPLHSFFSIPINPFQLSYNLSLLFTSIHHPTFHIPHSMSSLVVRSIAEPNLNFIMFLRLMWKIFIIIFTIILLSLLLLLLLLLLFKY
jgi:hypothetical protein